MDNFSSCLAQWLRITGFKPLSHHHHNPRPHPPSWLVLHQSWWWVGVGVATQDIFSCCSVTDKSSHPTQTLILRPSNELKSDCSTKVANSWNPWMTVRLYCLLLERVACESHRITRFFKQCGKTRESLQLVVATTTEELCQEPHANTQNTYIEIYEK